MTTNGKTVTKVPTVLLGRKNGQFIYRSVEGEVAMLGDSFQFRPVMGGAVLTVRVTKDTPAFNLYPLTILDHKLGRNLDAYFLATCGHENCLFMDVCGESANDPKKMHTFSVKWFNNGKGVSPVVILNGCIPPTLQTTR